MAEAICGRIAVPEQRDIEAEELKRVNEELKESLAACRFMLADARKKLTANSNEEIERRSKQKRRG